MCITRISSYLSTHERARVCVSLCTCVCVCVLIFSLSLSLDQINTYRLCIATQFSVKFDSNSFHLNHVFFSLFGIKIFHKFMCKFFSCRNRIIPIISFQLAKANVEKHPKRQDMLQRIPTRISHFYFD